MGANFNQCIYIIYTNVQYFLNQLIKYKHPKYLYTQINVNLYIKQTMVALL